MKDSQDLGNPMGTVFRAVTTGHNLLRFGFVQMRTPIGHDTIAAIRRVTASAIAND